MNPVVRRAILAYSVRNRSRKAMRMSAFMKLHDLRTVVFVGVAGETDQANEDIVETGLGHDVSVVAAVNPVPIVTSWPLLVGDGRALPLGSNVADVVISNAVVEHVGDLADQQRFVAEHVRVGRHWIMTTPNRWFPVESHTSVVFRHWSPRWRSEREEFTRLLSLKEFRALLPADAHVVGRLWSPTFTAFSQR